jgi:hypothetical protein
MRGRPLHEHKATGSDVSATAQSALGKNVGLFLKTEAVEIAASCDGQNVVSVQSVLALAVL